MSKKEGESKQSREKRLAWETNHRRYDFLRIWGKRYAHMKARHEGRSTHASNSRGMGLMSQEDFYTWCKDFENFQEFLALYFNWAQMDFDLWWSPSIDRIDPALGYVTGNIQWLSFADNTEKNNIDPITHKRIKRELVEDLT